MALGSLEDKLFDYLSAWLGGMCITAPHRPYAIGRKERDQWLMCMGRALTEMGASQEVKDMLKNPLFRVAGMLRNRSEPDSKGN